MTLYTLVTKTRNDPQRSSNDRGRSQNDPQLSHNKRNHPRKKYQNFTFEFFSKIKLRVRGRINSFTATKEDFITCFEGQDCLSRVMNECLAYMFTILGTRSKIFSPFSRLRPCHRENTGSRQLNKITCSQPLIVF